MSINQNHSLKKPIFVSKSELRQLSKCREGSKFARPLNAWWLKQEIHEYLKNVYFVNKRSVLCCGKKGEDLSPLTSVKKGFGRLQSVIGEPCLEPPKEIFEITDQQPGAIIDVKAEPIDNNTPQLGGQSEALLFYNKRRAKQGTRSKKN